VKVQVQNQFLFRSQAHGNSYCRVWAMGTRMIFSRTGQWRVWRMEVPAGSGGRTPVESGRDDIFSK